jgi:hypothetical protein
MDVKHKTRYIQTWKKHLFPNVSSTNTDTLVPLLYCCIKTCSIEVFLLLSQPLLHLCFNLFVISETFATKVVFSRPNRWKSVGPSLGRKVDIQEFPSVFLEFSPGMFGLYGVWHCHDEAVPFLPVGLDVFCKLHPKASTEHHSMMQNSLFHRPSQNGLTVLPQNPKTW